MPTLVSLSGWEWLLRYSFARQVFLILGWLAAEFRRNPSGMNGVWRIMSLSRNVSSVTVAASCLLFAVVPAGAQFVSNRYTLLLEDPPVSSRFVSREQMRTQAAEAYRRELETRQAAVVKTLGSRGIQVTGSASEVLNAIFVNAP